jgi:transcriptional regulator with XRE-family HTH domain
MGSVWAHWEFDSASLFLGFAAKAQSLKTKYQQGGGRRSVAINPRPPLRHATVMQEIEMLIGSHFKKKREAKGLSEKDLAGMIGTDFQESLFWDFESGDDNDIDGWLLGDFKKYCAALEIKPEEFADIPVSDLANLPLPDLVKVRREQKNLSIQDLAERIGYYPEVVEALENGLADSEVCIDALRSVGTELDIPFRLLLEKI